MMDELFGNPNSNIESVYYYIFPYILEYIDDYLDKDRLEFDFKNKISLEIFRKQIMFFGITKKDYLVIQNNKHHITDFSKTYPPDEFYFVNMFLYHVIL